MESKQWSSLVPCKGKCKSQFCPDCAVAHCVSWRERLREALAGWKNVLMLTLTVDPKEYSSPKEAYEYVGKSRRVAETIRKLNRNGLLPNKHFTLTLEFHKSGWPHWHVLIESRFVCKHKLQEAWKLGNCWVSKGDFDDVGHAINYATKYIVKTADDDENEFLFPDWVLDYEGNMRRFSTSRGLCKPLRKRKKRDPSKKTRARKRRTGRERARE